MFTQRLGRGGQAGWDKIPTLTENHLWLLPLHSLLHLFSQYCCLRFPAILALFPPHPTYFCNIPLCYVCTLLQSSVHCTLCYKSLQYCFPRIQHIFAIFCYLCTLLQYSANAKMQMFVHFGVHTVHCVHLVHLLVFVQNSVNTLLELLYELISLCKRLVEV